MAAAPNDIANFAQTVIGLAVIVGGSYYAVKGVKAKQSEKTAAAVEKEKDSLIDVLMKGKEEQKEELASLQEKHIKSQKDIANLQGQIDTLRTVPLKEISQGLTTLALSQENVVKKIDAIFEAVSVKE